MKLIDMTVDKMGAIGVFCMTVPLWLDLGAQGVPFFLSGLLLLFVSVGWQLAKGGE